MAHQLRIQRKRTKGWRMPDDAVYVGRPTRWGNPFRVGTSYDIAILGPSCPRFTPRTQSVKVLVADNQTAVNLFRPLVMMMLAIDPHVLDELYGKRLACWCSLDEPFCHADVLAELANPYISNDEE